MNAYVLLGIALAVWAPLEADGALIVKLIWRQRGSPSNAGKGDIRPLLRTGTVCTQLNLWNVVDHQRADDTCVYEAMTRSNRAPKL